MDVMSYFLKKYVYAGIGILAVVFVGYYFYLGKNIVGQTSDTVQRGESSQAVENGTTEKAPPVSVKVDGTGKYTVEVLPMAFSDAAPEYPSLDRPLVFGQGYPEEARKIMSDKMNATIAALKKDPNQYNEWLNLGIFRNGINDWEGARQIWEFLTVANPSQPAPFANLANLYAFSLKDPVRAEANLKKAIEKGPLEMSVYRLGYEFYRFVRKRDDLARDMLNQGIAKTDSPDLKYLRDHYDELK